MDLAIAGALHLDRFIIDSAYDWLHNFLIEGLGQDIDITFERLSWFSRCHPFWTQSLVMSLHSPYSRLQGCWLYVTSPRLGFLVIDYGLTGAELDEPLGGCHLPVYSCGHAKSPLFIFLFRYV